MNIDHEQPSPTVAFTDGACRGNPGPGGYAAVLLRDGQRQEVVGYEIATTNQRMELTAALRAVEAAPDDSPLTVTSDSEYVAKGVTEWLSGWKARGWRNSKRQAVANRDLWEALDLAISGRGCPVTFGWTRGHVGTELNEEADRLASSQAAIASGFAALGRDRP